MKRSRSAATAIILSALVTGSAIAQPDQFEARFGVPLRDDRSGIVEATSLLGTPLVRPSLDQETRERLQSNLEQAWDRWIDHPGEEMSFVWLGRRLAYLGRYRDAISVFTAGLEAHPQSYRLRRHRGHRYITIRRFDLAIADLGEAARIVETNQIPSEVEPDGAPNARNLPRSTTHSNIYYHLALAHYLRGEYAEALATHVRGEGSSTGNDDTIVAHRYWRYRALRELDRDADAAALLQMTLRPVMELIENHEYHRLLLLYRAGADLESEWSALESGSVGSATLGFGLAAETAARGRLERALEMHREIVESEAPWAAFGFIAAEAALSAARNDR